MESPGIVVVQDFLIPDSQEYKGYVNYMDRPDASAEFSGYLKYMKNEEKSTGLFTTDKDTLLDEDKKLLKNIMETAQKNGSLMWMPIISFNNAWLEKNHIYNSKDKYLDENKLREYTRAGVEAMLQGEKMDNAVWSAAIHYNTDNIHIHVAIVEPIPMRDKMIYKGREVYRGKMKYSNIEKCKSTIANRILSQSLENKKINEIIRESIIAGKKNHCIVSDPELAKQFCNIYYQLPNDRRTWKYNMNAMQGIRPELDKLSKLYIQKYHAEDMKVLTTLLIRQQQLYYQAYGNSKDPNQQNQYAQNKMNDMYGRLGNCILKEMLLYDKAFQNRENGLLEGKIEKAFETQAPLGVNALDWYGQYREGKKYLVGDGVEKNTEMALQYFEASAAQNNSFAQYQLGKMYLKGNGVKIDTEKAVTYFEASADQGNGYAQYQLGKMYLTGAGVKIDTGRAVSYFEASAEQGNEYAQYQLGKMYLTGEGVKIDTGKAVTYLEASADQGNGYAQYQLGKMYLTGEGVKIDTEKAVTYLEASADQGNGYAQYQLGKMYYYGNGVKKDKKKGIGYLKAARANGNENAGYLLSKGTIHRDIENVLYKLKNAMNKEYETYKNELEYEIDYARIHDFQAI